MAAPAPGRDWNKTEVTEKGQVTIPKELRDALGLGAGSEVSSAPTRGPAGDQDQEHGSWVKSADSPGINRADGRKRRLRSEFMVDPPEPDITFHDDIEGYCSALS